MTIVSKDVDVACRMDCRQFQGEQPLQAATQDFVVVNSQLHNEFDEFKVRETRPQNSCLPVIELFNYYCLSQGTNLLLRKRIPKCCTTYLEFNSERMDNLVAWVYKMREQSRNVQASIFETCIIEQLSNCKFRTRNNVHYNNIAISL